MFLSRRPVQPVFTFLAGYLFSTKSIPIFAAGSFNYSFEFGAGLEFFRSREPSAGFFANRALRAEYRYHHLSNAYTARANPGIDNGLLQITYSFGR